MWVCVGFFFFQPGCLKINCQSLFTAEQGENTRDFRLNCQLTEFKIEKNMYSAGWFITCWKESIVSKFRDTDVSLSGNTDCLHGMFEVPLSF